MVLKRIDALSAAKIGGIVYATFGLVTIVLVSLFSLPTFFDSVVRSWHGMRGWPGAVSGIGALIWIPVFNGVVGALGAALSALLYNVVAARVGGLQIDLE